MPSRVPSARPEAEGYGVSHLQFKGITPVAQRGLGGLIRDHFSNGRLFATVGAHGGLLGIGYWGEQRLGAQNFFKGDAESAWVKLLRVRVRLGDGEPYYLTLHDTKLYPFGYTSRCQLGDVAFTHDLLLLPDALVLRAQVVRNPQNLAVQFELVHQEACTAVGGGERTWGEMTFDAGLNALVVSCRDLNPPPPPPAVGDQESLAQAGLTITERDAPSATTWIGLGCTAPLTARRGYHRRSKHYLASAPISGREVAYTLVFATSEERLRARLPALRETLAAECAELLAGYERRLRTRPRISVGDAVLDSAFGQYPEVIHALKLPDRPGATRATMAGYFVWGWDGMTPMLPCALANEPEATAAMLRFFHETWHPTYGIPHAYTSTLRLSLKGPVPAQCQYLASLYHYVATTGDLALVRELWPTCVRLLERCRADEVGQTGLVSGCALWPDFPEAMEEDGDDVSALNNSLLYQGLRSMTYFAQALGHGELAASYHDWAQRLRASFVQYLFDDAQGYFISSCSARTLAPRKHYPVQAVFWITPFARELVAHAPGRIAAFMHTHLRSQQCMLSLPHWDTAWMADGNQLGSSFPTADYFYLQVHKLVGEDRALTTWLSHVRWFWERHTAPEAFTPEADNEAELGPDNPGCKQLQAVTCWYASLYLGLAGLDFDHEGLTLRPWGSRPIRIRGLKLRGMLLDLTISGSGNHLGALRLNGRALSTAVYKLPWAALTGKRVTLELVRTRQAPRQPVVVRADGLRVVEQQRAPGRLSVTVAGDLAGELVVQTTPTAQVLVDGVAVLRAYDASTGTVAVPCAGAAMRIDIQE